MLWDNAGPEQLAGLRSYDLGLIYQAPVRATAHLEQPDGGRDACQLSSSPYVAACCVHQPTSSRMRLLLRSAGEAHAIRPRPPILYFWNRS